MTRHPSRTFLSVVTLAAMLLGSGVFQVTTFSSQAELQAPLSIAVPSDADDVELEEENYDESELTDSELAAVEADEELAGDALAAIEADEIQAAATQPVWVRYAPTVRLHPGERYYPTRVAFFVNRSDLRFSHNFGRDDEIAGRRDVQARRWGSRP